MKIVLARHGNTFGPRDAVVWAGKQQDLPLVAFGKEQAELVGNCFLELDETPTHIYAGTLKRTTEYAKIIANKIKFGGQIIMDPRLNELDYGLWGGMTSEEIINSFGEQELTNWNEQSLWSETFFMGSEAETIETVRSFTSDLIQRHKSDDLILVVSSNGLLRYFLKLIPDEFENRVMFSDFKIKTGHLSVIEYHNNAFHLVTWNTSPTNLTQI